MPFFNIFYFFLFTNTISGDIQWPQTIRFTHIHWSFSHIWKIKMAALCHADTLTRSLARCARKEALSEAVDKQVAKDTPPSVPVTSCFLRGNYGQRRSHARTLSIYYPKTQSILMQAVCRASTRLRGHVTKRALYLPYRPQHPPAGKTVYRVSREFLLWINIAL